VIRRLPAVLLLAASLDAQTALFPLSEVKAGLRGVGRSVFSGDRIEEFQVEILGVLENAGPKQSIILGKLSGGALESTGVLQGMSGSPVYIGGRLVGAVALAFSFSKEPIAGIRPIEEMLRVQTATSIRAGLPLPGQSPAELFPPREEVLSGPSRLVEIATPVSLGGFTQSALDRFAPELRKLGLEPRQGILGGGRPGRSFGDPSSMRPGSMISVQLLTGDMSVGADGTLTHIDGSNVYAFGHRFVSAGATELPFARAEVLTVLPNLATSFKISAAREWMGTITSDYSTGVAGALGRRANMVPASIAVTGAGPRHDYRLEMVHDRLLSPFLLQMALFSAVDATGRAAGAATLRLRGAVEFHDGTPPLRLNNIYAGDANVPLLASLGAAIPLSYCMQSGLAGLRLKNVALEIERQDAKKQWQIDQVWAARNRVRPGETVELAVVLVSDDGAETTRRLSYTVAAGARPGPLYFTVSDGMTANMADYQQIVGATPRSALQMVSMLNRLRENSRAYVRVWRAEPSFPVQGAELPDPPASVSLILARAQPSLTSAYQTRNAKLAEMEIDGGAAVVSGSRTIQVEVRE